MLRGELVGKISATIWPKEDVVIKVETTLAELSNSILTRVARAKLTSLYLYLCFLGSFLVASLPVLFRITHSQVRIGRRE